MVKYFSIAFIIFFFLSPLFSYAQAELTVSINVGDTILTLSGKTSPNASVTLTENGSVVGTTTADASGNFSKSLLAQTPGVHNIGIYSTDTNGVTTSTVTYSVSLASLVETTLSNIVLPSTINLSGTEIAKGETVDISGQAAPSATMIIVIIGQSTIQTTVATDGFWKYTFDTNNLTIDNTYSVYVKASTTTGYQSEVSKTLSFKIQTAPTVTSAPTAASTSTITPVSTPTPTPIPRPVLPPALEIFDIGGIGKIRLADIAVVVRIWFDEWKNALIEELGQTNEQLTQNKSKKCDINGDKRCDLKDFSILMTYIER